MIRALTGGGTTVLLTTHYMDGAGTLADRVAVINSGSHGSRGHPRIAGGRGVSESSIRFRLPGADASPTLPIPAKVSTTNGIYEIKTDKEIEVLATLTNWALREKVKLGLTVERLTLEDVYLRLTGYETNTDSDGTSVSFGNS